MNYKRNLMKVFVCTMIFGAILLGSSWAEDITEAYIICMPGDYVNVRQFANTRGEPLGYLEAGDKVYLDGRKKNGFCHIVNASLELDEGWVFNGYIVSDYPEFVNQNAVIVSKGRLASRKYVNGKRTRWLKPLATVKVYYWTEEWALTNCGYVRSRYLEFEGE